MSHAKGAQWDKDEGFRYWTCEPVKPVSCGETSTSGEDGAFRFFTIRLGDVMSTKRDVCLRFLLSSEAGKGKRGMSWVHVVIWPWETHTWPVTYHEGTQTRRIAVRKLTKGKKDELDPCGNLTMGNTHMSRYVPPRDADTSESSWCCETSVASTCVPGMMVATVQWSLLRKYCFTVFAAYNLGSSTRSQTSRTKVAISQTHIPLANKYSVCQWCRLKGRWGKVGSMWSIEHV